MLHGRVKVVGTRRLGSAAVIKRVRCVRNRDDSVVATGGSQSAGRIGSSDSERSGNDVQTKSCGESAGQCYATTGDNRVGGVTAQAVHRRDVIRVPLVKGQRIYVSGISYVRVILQALGKPGCAIGNKNLRIGIVKRAAVKARDCAIQSAAGSSHSRINIGGAGISDVTRAGHTESERNDSGSRCQFCKRHDWIPPRKLVEGLEYPRRNGESSLLRLG